MRVDKDIIEMVIDISNEKNVRKYLTRILKYSTSLYEHSLNVGFFSTQIGYELGLRGEKLELLCKGALLHDLGMISVPKKIVEKKGKLTREEEERVKEHPSVSALTLRQNGFPEEVVEIAMFHHVKPNGEGYPTQEGVPSLSLLTMIVTACDEYNAIISERSYKDRTTYSDALIELINEAKDGKLNIWIVENIVTNVLHLITNMQSIEEIRRRIRRE